MAFDPSYPVATPRLLLRPFRLDDFDAVLDLHSRDDVTRYLYWSSRGEPEVRDWLARNLAATSIEKEGDGIQLAAVLASSGDLIGHANLMYVSGEHRHGEIGYIVHPAHQGKGYATEAARAMLAMGFEGLRLHRISAQLEARNVASARVLERLGMRREAHFVENEWVRGEWQSAIVYAMLDREWRAGERPGAGAGGC